MFVNVFTMSLVSRYGATVQSTKETSFHWFDCLNSLTPSDHMNHNFVGSYTTRYSKLTHLKFFRHAIRPVRPRDLESQSGFLYRVP